MLIERLPTKTSRNTFQIYQNMPNLSRSFWRKAVQNSRLHVIPAKAEIQKLSLKLFLSQDKIYRGRNKSVADLCFYCIFADRQIQLANSKHGNIEFAVAQNVSRRKFSDNLTITI